jgi:hypothetical protein
MVSSDGVLSGRAQWRVVAVVVGLAAVLRFAGIAAELRHLPHEDERHFVENASRMAAQRELDHRFHEYPGLFFFLLAPLLAFHPPPIEGAQPYILARALVSSFGVASVALVYLLGRRLGRPLAGMIGAAVLAVLPIDVSTADRVRPDVVLEAFLLAGLIALARDPASRRFDIDAGAAVGAATAIKFSGVLLAPSYVAARLADGSFRWRNAWLAAAVSLLAFAVLSPASLVYFPDLLAGIRIQLGYHYLEPASGRLGFAASVADYLLLFPGLFGFAGCMLLGIGVVDSVRDWRRCAPVLTLAVVFLLVLSTAEVRRQRFLVPVTGALALLCGVGAQRLIQLGPKLAWPVVAASLGFPLAQSIDYVRSVQRPTTRDLIVDWIDGWLPEGSRILTALPELGIDRRRFEVLAVADVGENVRQKALHWDLIAVRGPTPPELLRDWQVVYAAQPGQLQSGPAILLLAPPPELLPAYAPVAAKGLRATASENAAIVAAMLDGDLSTSWTTDGPQRPGSWIQLDFAEPTCLGRVELKLGTRVREFGKDLRVFTTPDGRNWSLTPRLRGRPTVPEQLPILGRSQVRILPPAAVRGLRIVQMGERTRPWSVAELVIDAVAAGCGGTLLPAATAVEADTRPARPTAAAGQP